MQTALPSARAAAVGCASPSQACLERVGAGRQHVQAASPLREPHVCLSPSQLLVLFLLPITSWSIFSPRHSKTFCTTPAERLAGSGLGLLMVILRAGNTPPALITSNEGAFCSTKIIIPATLGASLKVCLQVSKQP